MFEAVRVLNNSKPSRTLVVHDENGHVLASDSDKAEVIKSYFESHFTGNEPPLDPYIGEPRPLNTPITPSEVLFVLKNNTRACGPRHTHYPMNYLSMLGLILVLILLL